MKCNLSSKSETIIIVHHSNRKSNTYLISCLSSIFQQTLLPQHVFVLDTDLSRESISIVRYFNEETILHADVVSNLDSIHSVTFERIIHLDSNAIIDRQYIEKYDTHSTKNIHLSKTCTKTVLQKTQNCYTYYVDINSYIPSWILLYSKLYYFISCTFSIKKKCKFVYLLHKF